MQRSRQMVFVSGAPGAGKTSLAVPLAAEWGFALVCKDKLKETLHDALGAPRQWCSPRSSWREPGVSIREAPLYLRSRGRSGGLFDAIVMNAR